VRLRADGINPMYFFEYPSLSKVSYPKRGCAFTIESLEKIVGSEEQNVD
jgi:hypothetical protein